MMVRVAHTPKTHLGRVLVVDDDPGMRRLCARTLGQEGWDVVVVDGGKAALDCVAARSVPFDCVVSDVNMPEMDGFALIAAIRRHDDDLPVLLMTGDPSLDGAVRAIETGAVSYLSKPFEPETLSASVARAARRHGMARMRRRADSYATKMIAEREDLGARLDRALAGAWMAFQPIVDVTTQRVFAYEALLRTDEESLKRPDILIAAAERLDRVHELGRTVRAAVKRAAADAPDDVLLFVNVHGLELTDDEMFSPTGPLADIAPRVVLEITERVGLDPVTSQAQISAL